MIQIIMAITLIRSFLFTVVVAAAVFFFGCAPIYLPSTPNTPMLEEEGDVKLSAKTGISGIELQGAYALSDNTFLFGGLMGSRDDGDDDVGRSRHTYLELGAGRNFRPARTIVLEGSGGLGLGFGEGTSTFTFGGTTSERLSEGRYLKPFIQGNIALQTRVLDIGYANRFSLIQFGDITLSADGSEVIDNPSSPIFFEPSVYAQLGWDRIKLNVHVGGSRPISGDPDFDYNGLNVSLGLGFTF